MRSFEEILKLCDVDLEFYEAVMELESRESGKDFDSIYSFMASMLDAMEQSVDSALNTEFKGRLMEDEARRFGKYISQTEDLLSGKFIANASHIALAVSQYNSNMGRIVAAPTAGSCGILPRLLFAYKNLYAPSRDALVKALIVAGGVGEVIQKRATLAGAEGGCQAECGAAAAMGSAALTYLKGGSAEASAHAAALTIKSVMGLVCDSVAGLVEVPCIKRNGTLVALASICADMALAGVRSVIPPDEVVDAMRQVGKALPETLRETSKGGLAVTPKARAIEKKIFSQITPLTES
ncbi:L-serine dehydratase [Acetomicrobium flavidum]|uniref:L-serine dehydratase n=1 Tax=Acetomicrobium flavidum TaxID=49896 RepID=A0ABY1JCW3_9BACT|nr:L-serine dehydratase [Acetomicrobium flavidum]